VAPASAQPSPGNPPTPTPTGDQGPMPDQPPPNTGAPGQATMMTDAQIKELVDRELARILTERAAKDAAEKAARDASTADNQTDERKGEIIGQSGQTDVRLAFTLTNENVLVSPGETIPSVPGWRLGTPTSLGVQFFDNYDTRYSGFETLSHLVAYRDFHHGHWDAEASAVVRINELSESNLALSDDGSYVTLSNWKDPEHKDPTRISLTVLPVSSDRFRLGYSYRLSWGGSPEYSRANGAVPGAKLQYDTDKLYAFIGAKSATLLDRRTAELKSAQAVLAGAGYDVTPMLRLEANGGYFDRGYNELEDVNDQKVQLFGGSFQASLHQGMPLRSSVDYKLYKFNGEQVANLFSPEVYPGGFSWLAQSEFTVLGQTLKDPDKIGTTKIQTGMAGDLNVRAKLDRARLRFDLSYRDLAFILHSVPSLPTYEDFPSAYTTKPDLFASVGVDQNWSDFLTLGLIAGVERPATLTSPKGSVVLPGDTTDQDPTTSSTAVIRNNNIDTLITLLPSGKGAVPLFALKGSAKLTFGRIFTILVEAYYTRDPNQTRYERTCSDVTQCPFEYQFGEFNQLGFNLTVQARF
jgi:hypothetical protein